MLKQTSKCTVLPEYILGTLFAHIKMMEEKNIIKLVYSKYEI